MINQVNKLGIDEFNELNNEEIIENLIQNKDIKVRTIIYKNINPSAKDVNNNKIFEFYRKKLRKKLK